MIILSVAIISVMRRLGLGRLACAGCPRLAQQLFALGGPVSPAAQDSLERYDTLARVFP